MEPSPHLGPIEERNVPVIMRNGVTLRGALFRRDTDASLPALLWGTPHDKQCVIDQYGRFTRYVQAGFVVSVHDTRGRCTSDGEYPTAQDTDVIARLCVEKENGRVVALSLGSLRCRCRNSYSDPAALPQDEPTKFTIHMAQLAYVCRKGSRISPRPHVMARLGRKSLRRSPDTQSFMDVSARPALSCPP